MKLYRAISRKRYQEGEQITRHAGVRLPSNISYLVDNLLEYTRPASKPSRRHAIYASPTPELAMKWGVSAGADRAHYMVCEICCANEPTLMQLTHEDASKHPDILRLQQRVNQHIGSLSGAPMAARLALAPLCVPGVTKSDLETAMQADGSLAALVSHAIDGVTFWTPPADAVSPDGELFFELVDGNSYSQHPV